MVMSRFAILTIHQENTATGYIITVTTNHACHLWLRWTNITPVKHHSLSPERGASFDISTRYCFVGYHDNEQEEAGDTYEHTFIKEPWPVCETRWFYFIGQVSAGASASDSAVFIKHRVQPPITKYFYSDADPEETSVDGRACHALWAGLPWLELRAAPGTDIDDSTDNLFLIIYSSKTSDKWYMLNRNALLFDTSEIEVGRTILKAKLRIFISSVENADDWPFAKIALVASNPANNTLLVPADYQRISSTPLSGDFAKITDFEITPGYFTFNLNILGKLSIAKGGITKLGLREYYFDILGNEPDWIYYKRFGFMISSADHADPLRRPRLEVTYE